MKPHFVMQEESMDLYLKGVKPVKNFLENF